MSYLKQIEKNNTEMEISDIKYTLTGSPLLAKILERENKARQKEQENTIEPNKKYSNKSFIVIDKGPDAEHKTVLLVLQGKLISYGIIKTQDRVKDVNKLTKELGKAIHPENADIITNYLSNNKVEKLEFLKERK